MERAFRCPECQTIVSVPLHVFPVCPHCGYSRRGEAHTVPAHANWTVADPGEAQPWTDADGMAPAEEAEFTATPEGSEAPPAAASTPGATWLMQQQPRSSPAALALVIAGIPILLLGVVLVVMSLVSTSGPKHGDVWGTVATLVGLALLFGGVLVGRAARRPAPTTGA